MIALETLAPVKAHHQRFIAAPAARVWALLTQIDRWPEWHPAITRAKLSSPIAAGAMFDWKSGGIGIRSTLVDVEPARILSWTGKAIGTRAVHIWMLKPEAGGTRVETHESFDGWLVALMPGAMQKSLDKALSQWLDRLRITAELQCRDPGIEPRTETR